MSSQLSFFAPNADLSVFLAAEPGPPANSVVQTLERLGMSVVTPWSSQSRGDSSTDLLRAVKTADFVLVVYSKDPWGPYIAGIASALDRPVFVATMDGNPLPSFLGIHPHLSLESESHDTLVLALGGFLQMSLGGATRRRRRSGRVSPAPPPNLLLLSSLREQIAELRSSANETQLMDLTGSLLEASLGSAIQRESRLGDSHGSKSGDSRESRSGSSVVDFAVAVPPAPGCPALTVLVDLKAGSLTLQKLQSTRSRMAAAMAASKASLALVLYLDRSGRRFDKEFPAGPWLMAFDLEDFASLLLRVPFSSLVREHRNRLLHQAR